MTTYLKIAFSCICLAIPLLQASSLSAQQPKYAPPAPIPAQIHAARKVFIANARGDERTYEWPNFSGGPDRAYKQFYAAIKSLGRFELATAPADADILLEIRFRVPQAEQSVMKGSSIGTPYDPQFRLQIRDPKSNALLWGLTEHAQWAVLQGNRDKNFDQTLARVVAEVERIATQPPPPADDATKP
jgi:hypothetical protein